MREIKPVGKMQHQPLTQSPQAGFPEAIMDDTVYTMDDSRVLMGGKVTTASSIKGNVKNIKPAGVIRKRR